MTDWAEAIQSNESRPELIQSADCRPEGNTVGDYRPSMHDCICYVVWGILGI